MLEFIIGRACTGKTYQTIERLCRDSLEGRSVLIVPEQFTFESERSVVRNKQAVFDNISVLSFTRLFDSVVEYIGQGSAFVVSDFEKTVIMKKALNQCSEHLTVLSDFVRYRDFPANIADTIRDIKFSDITSTQLIDAAGSIGGVCAAKLKDIALIMDTYEALLSEKFIDPADKLTRLYEMLAECDYFKNTSVYFDSFSGFTGQQYKIITKIIEQADKVTFSFTADNFDDDSVGTFYNINNAIKKVKQIAKSLGEKNIVFTKFDDKYYSNSAMINLEEIMAGVSSCAGLQSGGNINVISCTTSRDEAVAAANIIKYEVDVNGYRYRDFILVARNAQDYKNTVIRQCKKNDVSCFCDQSNPLSNTPLHTYISCLLSLSHSYSSDNIFKLLKTGLLSIDEEEITELENYVYMWSIKTSEWQNEWQMSVNGISVDADNSYDIKRLEAINKTRKNIVDIIHSFRKEYIGTPKNRCKAVYNHLITHSVNDNLAALCDFYSENNNSYFASTMRQSWDCILRVLDSLVRVLDDTSISDADFEEMYAVAADSAQISNVPQMLDEVTFGSAERIRPSKPKISVIIGANQGIFPKLVKKTGILSAADMSKLKNVFSTIDDDAIKSAVEENYLVYSMLCCPVDKVYIIYAQKNIKGENLEPSSFVDRICEHFDDVNPISFEVTSSGRFAPRTPEAAFSQIGALKGQHLANVRKSLEDYEIYRDKLRAIDKKGTDFDFSVDSTTSKKLFGNEIHISASKFDTYHKCSLSYLLKFGLRAKKIKKADLNVLQRGTIIHYVLENIVARHKKDLGSLPQLQLSSEVDMLIHEYFTKVNGAELFMDARFAFLLDKISKSAKQTVFHLAQDFSQSGFEPKYFEITIGNGGDIGTMDYALPDNAKVMIDGKIDRVDTYENKVRVVDYKTGTVEFCLSDTLYGLNMQMLLYLYAFVRNGGNLVREPEPAGILYMPSKAVKSEKELRMNGLISNDSNVVSAMERANEGRFIPKYNGTNEGSFIPSEGFDLIFSKIDELILNMGNNILDGNFSANPTDGLKSKACAYCEYSSVCRSSDKKHRTVEKLSNDEVLEILKGENL